MGEVDPDNADEVKGMEHFCTVPGVFNADQVIVQSEKMRKVYIDVLTRYAGKDTKKYWEQKVHGLGSPKMDKVDRTRKEDLEIPDNWLKIIKKPDGTWKKIIFYNTCIVALLDQNEKMLEKIEAVFRIFQENKDEVTLLWRPHPLIRATIDSMRPQLWLSYKKLMHKYIEEGWGIYDDSADLNRAIAVSDAYYGDASSVVQLCTEAGMPVLLQNADV